MLVVATLATLAVSLGAPAIASPTRASPGLMTAAADTDGVLLTRMAEGAAKARARYLEGDFEGAVAAAADVDAALVGVRDPGCSDDGPTPCLPGPAFGVDARAWDAWADAQATRGLARHRLGDQAGMDTTFRAIVAVRPAWLPDRGFVPPKQLQRFEELRQALLSTSMVSLTINVDGGGEVVLDGRVVPRGTPVDVIPGTHYVGVGGRGRVVVVDKASTVAMAGTPAPGRTLTDPPGGTVVEDGPPWGLIAGGAAGVVVIAGIVVGAIVVLNQPEAPPNPGGVTVLVDASRLNGATP